VEPGLEQRACVVQSCHFLCLMAAVLDALPAEALSMIRDRGPDLAAMSSPPFPRRQGIPDQTYMTLSR
jgi:hypothetical protein